MVRLTTMKILLFKHQTRRTLAQRKPEILDLNSLVLVAWKAMSHPGKETGSLEELFVKVSAEDV